jgi:hypothetical protein|tara:strand:+ start:229 stop:492 length:264 start_codon:yes stop_codon:yes gene_type:complete
MKFIFGLTEDFWQSCQSETSQVLIIMTSKNSKPSSAEPMSEATGQRLAKAFEELQKLWLDGPLLPVEVREDRAETFIDELNEKELRS